MNMGVARRIFVSAIVLYFGGLAFGTVATSVAYVSDSDSAQLLRVDLSTGQASVVGPFGILANVTGLAYDPGADVMYGVSAAEKALYTIDMDTGAATLVGDFGLGESVIMQGLTYDTGSNTLYSSASTQKTLYSLDVTTGLASVVAFTSPTSISGLAIDPVEDILYGSPASGGGTGVYTIDKTTGAATRLGTGELAFNGLAFDPLGEGLFGVRNQDDSLYWIDTVSGEGTLIGSLGLPDVNPLGFEIVPEPISAALLGLGGATVLRLRRRR